MSNERTERDSAVLIVAYRNPEMLRTCLDAVAEHLPALPTLVWDNSGPAYSGVREMASDYPSIKWKLGSQNIGFAAAVNSLAHEVPEHDLLLLNPDAVLQGSLTGTFHALRSRGVAAAAPLTVDENAAPERYRRWDVAHRQQSLTRALVSSAGYSFRGRGRTWSDLYRCQPRVVDGYLTGACLAISRDAWNTVGAFDEEFFLYGEEADWQRRARAKGWSLVLVDELGISHTAHGTVANDSVAAVRSHDLLRGNIALNLERERGSRQANLYLAGTSLLDRIQPSGRRRRAARRRHGSTRPAIILTTQRLSDEGPARRRVLIANELHCRGYEVTIVCLTGFGPLIAEIPAGIRVIRQPWWAPMVDITAERAVVVPGDTKAERAFGALFLAAGPSRRRVLVAHGSAQPATSGVEQSTDALEAAVKAVR